MELCLHLKDIVDFLILCVSVNEQVVHGIPSDYMLQEGDIVSVDCGVCKNGFYGDSAYTFLVGEVDNNVKSLLKVTKKLCIKESDKRYMGKELGI